MSHGCGAQVLDQDLLVLQSCSFGDNSSLSLVCTVREKSNPWLGFHYRLAALSLVSLDFRQTDLLSVITWLLPGSSQRGSVGRVSDMPLDSRRETTPPIDLFQGEACSVL